MTRISERPVNLGLQAESDVDPDTGRQRLLAADGSDDWQETTAAGLRARIVAARAELERAEALAARYEAVEALVAFLDDNGWRLVVNESRVHNVIGLAVDEQDRRIVTVPPAFDPTEVYEAVRCSIAREQLDELRAVHRLDVEEWDTAFLDEKLRDGFQGWYCELHGRPLMVFPLGQHPVERLAVARALIEQVQR